MSWSKIEEIDGKVIWSIQQSYDPWHTFVHGKSNKRFVLCGNPWQGIRMIIKSRTS